MPKTFPTIESSRWSDTLHRDGLWTVILLDADELEQIAESPTYSTPVERALMQAFLKISKSKDKECRSSDFAVFWGDVQAAGGYFFAVAVPAGISQKATELVVDAIRDVATIHGEFVVDLDTVPVIPFCRYRRGIVIIYRSPGPDQHDKATGLRVVSRDRVLVE